MRKRLGCTNIKTIFISSPNNANVYIFWTLVVIVLYKC